MQVTETDLLGSEISKIVNSEEKWFKYTLQLRYNKLLVGRPEGS